MAKRYSERWAKMANQTDDGAEVTKVNLSDGPNPKTMVLKVYRKNETTNSLRDA
jgi:hypothetical protein